jgi:hypothetical protein
MRFVAVFFSLAVVITGAVLVVSFLRSVPYNDPVLAMIGILLLAGGMTGLWKMTGFRGLKPK